MFTVDRFLGINESADGYTELNMGEASKMVNWTITDACNITVRPGIQRIDFGSERSPAPILAVWAGYVADREYLVVADLKDGTDRIWMYTKEEGKFSVSHTQDGALDLTRAEGSHVKIFTFNGELLIMSSGNTVRFTGEEFVPVEYYTPLVITGADPAGGGTTLESINLLSSLRRMDFSADGESTAFVLPEEAKEVTALKVDNVETAVADAGSYDRNTHTFTFANTPVKGVGNVEFTYDTDASLAEENRMKIIRCPLVEAYNGATDTRLFVAGDGSNICYYSGVPQSGKGSALYFPGMNEVAVDMSGSPITGIVRHYSKLLVFKPDGAYTITYEPVTLVDGSTIAGFYLRAANREFGNQVPGQVQTVNNYPRTLSKGGLYEWRITSSYYQDERYAKRVSDPVEKSLGSANMERIVTCDDDHNKTYYIFLNDDEGTVLVNRYALGKDGLWCMYRSSLCRNVRHAMMHGGTMAFATDTELFYFDADASKDAPEQIGGQTQTICALWESGYMDFGVDYKRKYSSRIYVSMLPESSSSLTITASTDRRESYREKVIGTNLFGWSKADFARWSFDMNDTPKIRRVQLKVKKFVYYKLIFKVEEPGTRATVLAFDQQVRFSSMAK
jgi:hypothetical protein